MTKPAEISSSSDDSFEAVGVAGSNKAASDTVIGCRERAAADSEAAAIIGTVNQRLRLEHSAASWLVRADMIQRFNDSAKARKAAAVAMWAEDEMPLLRHPKTPADPVAAVVQ